MVGGKVDGQRPLAFATPSCSASRLWLCSSAKDKKGKQDSVLQTSGEGTARNLVGLEPLIDLQVIDKSVYKLVPRYQ